MNGDGTNPRALTATGSNLQPAWSPDGTRLVYRHSLGCGSSSDCTDFLSVINADASGNSAITPELNQPATDPDWSPDGQWIAFGSQACTYYSYYYYYLSCYETGLAAVRPDGTGRTQILTGYAWSPAWKPGTP
jgi:Tol biopolymer transport system component